MTWSRTADRWTFVSQDPALLHRSIRDNVCFGLAGVIDSEIWDAAKICAATDFINSSVDMDGNVGLEAQIGDRGIQLSGGQRQRLALMRVFLREPKALVLDEATSALDAPTERFVLSSVRKKMPGKLLVVTTHRINSLLELDRVIVLKSGAVVENGSPSDLLSKQGEFYRLWNAQSESSNEFNTATADHC